MLQEHSRFESVPSHHSSQFFVRFGKKKTCRHDIYAMLQEEQKILLPIIKFLGPAVDSSFFVNIQSQKIMKFVNRPSWISDQQQQEGHYFIWYEILFFSIPTFGRSHSR
jgi:hypothetical protein